MNFQTYADIKNEVTKRLGGRQDLSARIDQWTMDAFTELTQAPKASFRELDALYEFTQPANNPRAAVPADFWFILSLRDPTRKLDQVHWQVLDRTYRTVGIPTRYARYQDNIELDPVPAEAVLMVMRYRRRLPELEAGLPIPIEREWHEILVTLTVAKGLEALQRFEEALPYKSAVDVALGQRQDNPLLKDDNYESTIGVRFR